MYWLFLGLTLASDPPVKGALDTQAMPAEHQPEPAPQAPKDPAVQLIPGIRNAGLPPMAPETLPPPITPTEVRSLSDASVAPMAAPIPPAPQTPPPPPPLKTHEGLPPPPPPIEEAGLPPMAEDLE